MGVPGARRRSDQTLATQVLEDGARRGRLVEGIEMNAVDASPQQLGALARAILDAEREAGVRVVSRPFEGVGERWRHGVAGELRDALDLPRVGDRHDAGHDRDADPGGARPLDEPEEEVVVVEELRDHDVEPGVHLGPQVLDAAGEIATLRMPLGVAAADQGERMALLADVAHQIGGVAEAVGRRAEVGVLRAVAADGDQVLDPARDHQLAVAGDLLAAGLDGGDVDRALEPETLDALDDLDRRLARLAAGAGDRHEGGRERTERVDGPEERRLALGRPRGKELEGDEGPAAAEEVLDLHPGGLARGALLLQRLHALVLPVVVPGGHRHQERFHAALALATQDAEALVELAEVLVGARAVVHGTQEEIAQPGDREAERGQAQLVREGIPLGERQRAQRLVARDQRLEALEIVAVGVDAERVHRRGEIEDELAAARRLEVEHRDQLLALEEQVVAEEVAVNDALRQLVLQVVLQVRHLVVERADHLAEVGREAVTDVGVELCDAIVCEAVLDAFLVALADQVEIGEGAADVLEPDGGQALRGDDLAVLPAVDRDALPAALAVPAPLPVGDGLGAGKAVLAQVDQQIELALHVELTLDLVDPEDMAAAGRLQAVVRVHRAMRDRRHRRESHEGVILHDVGEFWLAEFGVHGHQNVTLLSNAALTLWNFARIGLATVTLPPSRCQQKNIGRSLERGAQADDVTPMRGHQRRSGHSVHRGLRATQMRRPWWISRWAKAVQLFGGRRACRSDSMRSGSS